MSGNNILLIPDNINSDILAVLEKDLNKKYDSVLKKLHYNFLNKNEFTVENRDNVQLSLTNRTPVFNKAEVTTQTYLNKNNYHDVDVDDDDDDDDDEYSNNYSDDSFEEENHFDVIKHNMNKLDNINLYSDNENYSVMSDLTLPTSDTPRIKDVKVAQEGKIRKGLESIASSLQSLSDNFDAIKKNLHDNELKKKIDTLSPFIQNFQSRLTNLENQGGKIDTNLRTLSRIKSQINTLNQKMEEKKRGF